MAQNWVKSCKACSADSEVQYGGINHGRVFCLDSSHEGAAAQLPQWKPPVPWSEEQVQVIQRQMDLLSMRCKAPAVGSCKVPSDNRVDACGEDTSSDETKDGNRRALSRGIELDSQLGLPFGRERFLDINSGEIYYIDWSCSKSDLHDDDAKSSSCTSSDISFEGQGLDGDFECSNSVKDDGRMVLSLKGCKQCLIYFLIPREIKLCPSCKTCFLEVDKLSGSCG